ncbi:hypothetical protein E4U50_000227 [Claviceps purpurea]|nr:hypothetical protein E4U12_000594 [Claviceps purpurea]KAG6195480.1 hypothetical protein E4U50_000227 [Claviceps purpurea]
MHALSLLALFLPLVAARHHKMCTCRTYTMGHSVWETNSDLAHWICNKIFLPTALWQDDIQRCVAREGSHDNQIDGDDWENQCIYHGTRAGYFPLDAAGNPTSSTVLRVNNALGQCFQ